MSHDDDELDEHNKKYLRDFWEIKHYPKKSEYKRWAEKGEEYLARKLRELKRKSYLIHSREDQNKQRLENRLKVLRWLSIHRHSRVTILAYMLGKQVDGVRNICNLMAKDNLLKKMSFGYHGRHEFMIFGITRAGLDFYYNYVDVPPEERSTRVFSTSDGMGGTSEHDYVLQWVQIHLESLSANDAISNPQSWRNHNRLPFYTKNGKIKQPESWLKYPDAIFYKSPYVWHHPENLNYGLILDQGNLYNHLSDEYDLRISEKPGLFGYLNVAIEIEKTTKNKAEYRNIISKHEHNIGEGRYDLVLYYLPTERRADTLQGYCENILRERHQEPGSWRQYARAFQFASYAPYVDRVTEKFYETL